MLECIPSRRAIPLRRAVSEMHSRVANFMVTWKRNRELPGHSAADVGLVLAQQRYDESKRRLKNGRRGGRNDSGSLFPGGSGKPRRIVFPESEPEPEKAPQ